MRCLSEQNTCIQSVVAASSKTTYRVCCYSAFQNRISVYSLLSQNLPEQLIVCCCNAFQNKSPLVHLHVVGMSRFMSDMSQPSLPTTFHSVAVSVCIFMALSTVFHSINSPDNSPFSYSVLPVLSLPCCYFQLYIPL